MQGREPITYKVLVFAPNKEQAEEFLHFVTGFQNQRFELLPDNNRLCSFRDGENNRYNYYYISIVNKDEAAIKKAIEYKINDVTSSVLVTPEKIGEAAKIVETYLVSLGIPVIPVYDSSSVHTSTPKAVVKKHILNNQRSYDAEFNKEEKEWTFVESASSSDEELKLSPNQFKLLSDKLSDKKNEASSSSFKNLFSRKKQKELELQTFENKNREKIEDRDEIEDNKESGQLSVSPKQEKKDKNKTAGFFSKIKQNLAAKPKNKTTNLKDKPSGKKEREETSSFELSAFSEKKDSDSDSENESRLTLTRKRRGQGQ